MDNNARKAIWVLFLSLVSAIGLLFDDNVNRNIFFKIIVIAGVSILSLFFLIIIYFLISDYSRKK
nr:cytochrome c biogenesis factor [Mucilaginibacter sp. X4EP1]